MGGTIHVGTAALYRVLREKNAEIKQLRTDLANLKAKLNARPNITHEDAAALRSLMFKYDFDMRLCEDAAAERAGDALDDHAEAVTENKSYMLPCPACNGCGWCEGSPAYTCHDCEGTGSVESL